MRKFKLGNSLWEYTPKTNEFNSVDEAWNVLSNAFARSRTQDPNKEFKVYLHVYEANKYGFMEWTLCKEGFAKHI
jgi:hypothetical protein